MPKQAAGFLHQGFASTTLPNQQQFREPTSPPNLKGGARASPDAGAPQRGQPNLDASAKSMVTVQSDPDGGKFLRTGIYKHNQTSKVSKEYMAHNNRNLVGISNAAAEKSKQATLGQAQGQMIGAKGEEGQEPTFATPDQIQEGAPAPQAHILMIKHGERVGSLDDDSKISGRIPSQEMQLELKSGKIKE